MTRGRRDYALHFRLHYTISRQHYTLLQSYNYIEGLYAEP